MNVWRSFLSLSEKSETEESGVEEVSMFFFLSPFVVFGLGVGGWIKRCSGFGFGFGWGWEVVKMVL